MFFLSFVVITNTPAELRDFLIGRGILTTDSNGTLVGALPGMEWIRIPNAIVTNGAIPAVYDTRAVFLVKFSSASEADQEAGQTVTGNQYDWSKFGQWVKANSTIVTAPANWRLNGQAVGDSYKINGQNVWLIRDNPERFGVWQ